MAHRLPDGSLPEGTIRIVSVIRHVLWVYGIATFDPEANTMKFRPRFAEVLNGRTSDDMMEHIRKTVRRFAPHADEMDSKILQCGVFCFHRASIETASSKFEEIFDDRADLDACCDRWEFAVTGEEPSQVDVSSMPRVSVMLAERHGLVSRDELDPDMLRLGDAAEHADGVAYVLGAVRERVGPGPTDTETKLMAMYVLSSLGGSAYEKIGPALAETIDRDELNRTLESHRSPGADPATG